MESTDDTSIEKNQQMAMLLDFQANPSRHALLNEILTKGLIADVIPALAGLYDNLETKFNPLTIITDISTSVTFIKSHPQLSIYAVPLQRIAVLRLTQLLSRVYSAVKIDFVMRLLSNLDVNAVEAEKIILEAVAQRQLQLRFDHCCKCIRFGSVLSVAPVVEAQLSQVANKMNALLYGLEKEQETEKDKKAAAASRKEYFALVQQDADVINSAVLER
eukprot:gene6148-7845_t